MVDAFTITSNFALGLLSSFSPCLFPLLPTYVTVSAKTTNSQKEGLISSLMVILGILVVFSLFGLLSGLIGSFLFENYNIFGLIQGLLILISGLVLLISPSFLYNIHLPARLENYIYRDTQKNKYYISFILGLAYTIIAAPCAAGYFILVWSSILQQQFTSKIIILLAFALGAGIPFILISVFIGNIKSSTVNIIHKTTVLTSKFLGLILIGASFFLLNDVLVNILILISIVIITLGLIIFNLEKLLHVDDTKIQYIKISSGLIILIGILIMILNII